MRVPLFASVLLFVSVLAGLAAGERGPKPAVPPAAVTVAAPPPSTGVRPRLGMVMLEIARRFEILGKAGQARKFDLVRYEIEELSEIFEIDFVRAMPPEKMTMSEENLHGLGDAFAATNLRELKLAARAADRRGLAEAYARAAQVCNGCHRATEHAFIEIPLELGREVPSVR